VPDSFRPLRLFVPSTLGPVVKSVSTPSSNLGALRHAGSTPARAIDIPNAAPAVPKTDRRACGHRLFDIRIPTLLITRPFRAPCPGYAPRAHGPVFQRHRMLAPQAGDTGSNPVGANNTHQSFRARGARGTNPERWQSGRSRRVASAEPARAGGSNPSLSSFFSSIFFVRLRELRVFVVTSSWPQLDGRASG
jgi:hypothetical protein